MNRLQAALADICIKERLREKVLIASSFFSGYQIAESIVKSGTPYLNLRVSTVMSLAHDFVALDLASEGISLLPDMAMIIFVEDAFNELRQDKESYFRKLETKEGIVNALARGITDLRMAGLKSSDLQPGQFVDKKKGSEIKALLDRYEIFLAEKKYADDAELLCRAIRKVGRKDELSGDSLYLALADVPYRPLEKTLINLLPGDKFILPYDSPKGLAQPTRFLFFDDSAKPLPPESDIELLSWLFETEKAPSPIHDGSVSIFHAIGRRNEVREVFRLLLSSGTKSDEAEMIYTSYEDYLPLIYEVSQKLGIEITVEEGLPMSLTHCGRAALGFIDWISSNFEAGRLRRLITGGCLSLKDDGAADNTISPVVMGKILRESGIGWSRERYEPALTNLAVSYLKRAEEKDEEIREWRESYLRKNSNARFLLRMTKTIIDSIPLPDKDGRVSMGDICRAVNEFICAYGRVAGELDGSVKAVISEKLAETATLSTRMMGLQEALSRVEMMLLEMRVGQSGPAPGCLHVSSCRRGGRSGRTDTFVVGCDSQLLPGTAVQNPVLLDVELREISKNMMQSADLLKEHLFQMASLLSSLRGRVTLSFSSYDVLENRESSPSSLLLQTQRLLTGNPAADYTNLFSSLKSPAGYVPTSESIDHIDYWIKMFVSDGGLRRTSATAFDVYPGLAAGLKAETARLSDKVTEYDGKISWQTDQLDPRSNNEIIMSASMIEKFGSCPFSYLLRYVLRIKPLEETEVNTGQWLDAAQRGKLLHVLFCDFMTELSMKKEKPSLKKHIKRIGEIAKKYIDAYRQEIPPPGEAVFAQEVKSIYKTTEVFLRTEEEHCKDVEPAFFELSFGSGEDIASPAMKEPLIVSLGRGKKISVRGSIDRIDRTGDHTYEIWDYKTGSAYGYTDSGFFDKGKKVQHALYAVAAEELLRKCGTDASASVTQAGYFFPSEKGSGLRILRGRNDKALRELLDSVFDLIKTGIFVSANDDSSCKYCDYKTVCGSDVIKRSKRKYSNIANAELADLLKVKAYE